MPSSLSNTLSGKDKSSVFRRSTQNILPICLEKTLSGQYSLYPLHTLSSGNIFSGYQQLSDFILEQPTLRIDGFSGVLWEDVILMLERQFEEKGKTVRWLKTEDYFRKEESIRELRADYLGEPSSVWGKKADLELKDFLRMDDLEALRPDQQYDINIVIGLGAAFSPWSGPLIYLDVPKNEIQYRLRAGAINNMGISGSAPYEEQYKSLYFIDWVVLRNHREAIFDHIDIYADSQWQDDISWIKTQDLRLAIDQITASPFRVRPWFEKGVWGGQLLKSIIPGISQEETNYAWSFEMIVPENGVILHQNGTNLEIPFDLLMYLQSKNILGKHAPIFKTEFPIRFDFLDTVNGGNLSVQVHPQPDYIRSQFGESITQDETYYILDCDDEASVYLGLQQGVEEKQFREAAEQSFQQGTVMAIDDYVQKFLAKKHDLFLIPHGTVHSAGKGNLVLEISATPYIFTFKIYDWLRPDLNGKPRPISLGHAFANIEYSYNGAAVADQLVSKPYSLAAGPDWEIVDYPTHPKHFYAIHQIRLHSSVDLNSDENCKVMMLVEGDSVTVVTASGEKHTYYYAETFVIPAATGAYTVVSSNGNQIKLIEAFLKPEHPLYDDLNTKQY